MQYTNKEFAINSMIIAPPVEESYQVLRQIVFQEEGTGRNQKGDMILTIIGRAIEVNMEWKYLDQLQYDIITKELDKVVFTLTYPIDGKRYRAEFYCPEYTVSQVKTSDGMLYSLGASCKAMNLNRVITPK